MWNRRLLPLLLCLASACAEEEPPAEQPPAPDGFEYGDERPCAAPSEGIDRFREEGLQRGLTEVLSDSSILGEELQYGRGGSLAARDLDGDGDVDLLFGRLDAAPDLYENQGDGTFSLVPDAIAAPPGLQFFILSAVDLTGDRLPEVVLGAGRGWYVFNNRGALSFGEPELLISEDETPGLSFLTMAFGDADADGDLDIALPSIGLSGGAGGDGGEPDPGQDLVLLREGGRTVHSAQLRREGEGSTVQVGIFTDRDADGDLDLFLPSDSGPPSRFWRNDGLGGDGVTWVDDGPEIGANLSMAAMGIDTADLDGDGLLDYCMSDTGPPVCIVSAAGTYVDVGTARGLTPATPVGSLGTVGWGFDLADFDADGLMDAVQASGPFPDAQGEVETELPNLLWHGRPDGRFDEVGAAVGFDSTDNDLGLATVDVDGDGWLDIVVAGPLDTPQLFMNRCGEGAWLEVELRGQAGNREGFHARVEVTTGSGRQVRELQNLRGQSQGPARLHFGLGNIDSARELVVRWADGAVSTAEQVPLRRRIVVTHPDADSAAGDDDDVGVAAMVGLVQSLYDQTPISGATITALGEQPPRGATSGADGSYELELPLSDGADLLAEADGWFPQVLAVDPSTQRDPAQGAAHLMIPADDLDLLYEEFHAVARDPVAATVWVRVTSTSGPLPGTTVALSSAHAGAVILDSGDKPTPGSTLTGEATMLSFGNVAAGALSVQVTLPGDETCIGRTEAVAAADGLLFVQLSCD